MLGASLLSCHHLKYLELEYSREACRHLSWEEWIALPPSTSLAPLYAALQGPASATLRHLALDHCYLAEPAKTRVTVLAGTDGFITGVVDADAHPLRPQDARADAVCMVPIPHTSSPNNKTNA